MNNLGRLHFYHNPPTLRTPQCSDPDLEYTVRLPDLTFQGDSVSLESWNVRSARRLWLSQRH